MSGYDEVDRTIAAWADANVAKLFDEWDGKPARFAYLPGLRSRESFQIWVQPPAAGRIAVSAASADTDDESEHCRTWEGPVGSLAAMLEEAKEAIRQWANRPPSHGD